MSLTGRRVPLLLVAVWLVGTVVATATGLLAIRLVGEQVGDPASPPLSAVGVDEALEEAQASGPPSTDPTVSPAAVPTPSTEPPAPPVVSTSRSPSRSATPSRRPAQPSSEPAAPSAAATTGTFSNAGGSIGVRCNGANPVLLYATPAPGYRVDEQKAEGGRLEVRFRGGEASARLRVVCAAAGPVLQDSEEED